jgi:hypothetical protein
VSNVVVVAAATSPEIISAGWTRLFFSFSSTSTFWRGGVGREGMCEGEKQLFVSDISKWYMQNSYKNVKKLFIICLHLLSSLVTKNTLYPAAYAYACGGNSEADRWM